MEDNIILTQIPIEEIDTRIKKIISEAINNISGNYPDEIPLGRAVEDYGLTRQTLYNLHNKGVITLRKLQGKTFASRSDISKAMCEMKRKKQSAAVAN